MDGIYSFGCESFMADRTGLGGTMLHYLAIRRTHTHTFENHTNLLGNLTAVQCRVAFKTLLNAKAALS